MRILLLEIEANISRVMRSFSNFFLFFPDRCRAGASPYDG